MNNPVLRAESRAPVFFVLLGLVIAACALLFLPHQAFASTLTISGVHISSNDASTTLATSTSQVGIEFTTNQALVISATSTVKITGAGATLASTTPSLVSGTTYIATTTLGSATNPPDGVITFLIYVVGTGATYGYASTTASATNDASAVRLDSVAPSLYQLSIKSSNTGSSTLAKALDTITVTATSSENIATPTTFTIDGQPATFSLVTGSTTWKGTYVVQSSDTQGVVPIDLVYTDSAGNAGSDSPFLNATSTEVTVDTTAPVITLVGASSDTTDLEVPYTDPGATASDNHDGNLTSSIVVTGSVDDTVLGGNTLAYNVSDAAGNAATTVDRSVTVEQQTLSSGSSGGGGGGGGVFVPYVPPNQTTSTTPTTPTTPAAPVSGLTKTQVQSIITLLESFNADQSVINAVNASLHGQATAGTGGSMSSFTRDLDVGFTGADVQALQAFLNSHGYQVSASGPGSPGNETTLFGSLTRAALAKFQAANGISPAAGYFGPKTRAFIQSLGQ